MKFFSKNKKSIQYRFHAIIDAFIFKFQRIKNRIFSENLVKLGNQIKYKKLPAVRGKKSMERKIVVCKSAYQLNELKC